MSLELIVTIDCDMSPTKSLAIKSLNSPPKTGEPCPVAAVRESCIAECVDWNFESDNPSSCPEGERLFWWNRGRRCRTRFAANTVLVSLEPVGVGLQHSEVPLRYVSVVEIGRWGGMQKSGYEASQFGGRVVVVPGAGSPPGSAPKLPATAGMLESP